MGTPTLLDVPLETAVAEAFSGQDFDACMDGGVGRDYEKQMRGLDREGRTKIKKSLDQLEDALRLVGE